MTQFICVFDQVYKSFLREHFLTSLRKNILRNTVGHISSRPVTPNHISLPPVCGLGPTYPKLLALLPHHLSEVPSPALPAASLEVVIFYLSVPHLGRFLAGRVKLSCEHRKVLACAVSLLPVGVPQSALFGQFLSVPLCVPRYFVGPLQRGHTVHGTIFVVRVCALLSKGPFGWRWRGTFWFRFYCAVLNIGSICRGKYNFQIPFLEIKELRESCVSKKTRGEALMSDFDLP